MTVHSARRRSPARRSTGATRASSADRAAVAVGLDPMREQHADRSGLRPRRGSLGALDARVVAPRASRSSRRARRATSARPRPARVNGPSASSPRNVSSAGTPGIRQRTSRPSVPSRRRPASRRRPTATSGSAVRHADGAWLRTAGSGSHASSRGQVVGRQATPIRPLTLAPCDPSFVADVVAPRAGRGRRRRRRDHAGDRPAPAPARGRDHHPEGARRRLRPRRRRGRPSAQPDRRSSASSGSRPRASGTSAAPVLRVTGAARRAPHRRAHRAELPAALSAASRR